LPPVDNFILVVALACEYHGALCSSGFWRGRRGSRCGWPVSDDADLITPTHRIVAAIMPALILNSIFGLTFFDLFSRADLPGF